MSDSMLVNEVRGLEDEVSRLEATLVIWQKLAEAGKEVTAKLEAERDRLRAALVNLVEHAPDLFSGIDAADAAFERAKLALEGGGNG